MNILIVSQYFKPETFIINELVLELENLGHNITVLTGKPNYPEGKIFAGYRKSGIAKESYGKSIEVIRVPMIPRYKGRTRHLIMNYLSYAVSGTFLGVWLLRNRKFDFILVFAVSPITQAFPALFIKWLKGTYICLWVQDLWPESLIVTKYVKNSFAIELVRKMVRFIYNTSDLILVQSKQFFEPIQNITHKTKIEYYPNSFKVKKNTDAVELPENVRDILKNNFCVTFAGNIGKAQSVETIVEAAKILKNEKNLKIVFVGSGSSLNWIKREKERFCLDNIECVGRFDISVMPAIFSQSKAMLLTLNADDILKYTLPWKTQSYLAAGKPIIGAIDGEGARVINEASCGFVGPAEDAEVLSENIKKMMSLSEAEIENLGQKGFSYFEKNFEMETQAQKLLEIIKANMKNGED